MISAKAFGTFAEMTLSKDRVKEIAFNNLTEDNLQNENNRSKKQIVS